MDFSREHRRGRYTITAVATLGVALGAVGGAAAQPVGALLQLPRPDACTQAGGDGVNCRDGVGLDGANKVVVSPDGKHAYVPSLAGNSLAVFARDQDSGALTQLPAPDGCHADVGDGISCHDALGLFGAADVAVSPDGAHVYVASFVSSSITVFARNKSTGALTQLAAPDGCVSQFGGGGSGCTDMYGPISPTAVMLSPNGKHVYALAFNGDAIGVFARDKATGKLTQLPAPQGCIAANGDGVTCTSAIALDGPQGMALSKNNRQLYVTASYADAVLVFARDEATGALTQLPAPNGCVAENGDGVTCTAGVGLSHPAAVLVAKQGRDVYVASTESDAVAIFDRDASTGALSQVPAPNGCLAESGDGVTCTEATGLVGAVSMTQAKNGQYVYVASVAGSSVAVFQRDKKTGFLAQLAAPYGCVAATGDGSPCLAGLGLGGARSITLANSGKHAYVAAYSGDAIAAFAVVK